MIDVSPFYEVYKSKLSYVINTLLKLFLQMNDSSSREIQRIWRIQKTIKEICNDRQYTVAQSELEMTLEEFKVEHVKNGQIE